MNICPISLEFAVIGIANVAHNRIAGITHLSGAQGMSFSTFAANRANVLGTPTKLVNPTMNTQDGSGINQNIRCARLGMGPPSQSFSIDAHVLQSTIADLHNEIKNFNNLSYRTQLLTLILSNLIYNCHENLLHQFSA